MSGHVPFSVLRMPSGMKELIQFSLYPLGITPSFDQEDVLAYRLSYASGLSLTVLVLFVARRRWLIFRRPFMCLSVVDADASMNVRSRYMTEYVPAPISPHDMQFSAAFMVTFAVATRAVADELGAGERIDAG